MRFRPMKFVFFSLVSYTLNLLLVLVLVFESLGSSVFHFGTVKLHEYRDLVSAEKKSRSRIYATANSQHLHLYLTIINYRN